MRRTNVHARHDDALARMPWDEFERLMARHYAARGYRVEHSGTGATASWRGFDGGIDLKLYRGDEYIVVQCKHLTDNQVTHNVVHQLIGVMHTQKATGAIVVITGEFSKAAIAAASKIPQIELIDGVMLRHMLASTGDLPWAPRESDILASMTDARRERRGVSSRRPRSRRSPSAKVVVSYIVLIGIMVAIARFYIPAVLNTMNASVMGHTTHRISVPPSPKESPVTLASGQQDLVPARAGTSAVPPPPVLTKLSKKESEAWDKQNAESMRILEKTTPALN